MKQHTYQITVTWSGATTDYRAYTRSHEMGATGKPMIPGSSDPSFRGDPDRYNPEELLVASLSSCHMLWFLHLCATNGIVVTSYRDDASGTMEETPEGGGRFREVTLYPRVEISSASDTARAEALHAEANRLCFIANSVNFPVHHRPTISVKSLAHSEG